jgi:hypothetical protein
MGDSQAKMGVGKRVRLVVTGSSDQRLEQVEQNVVDRAHLLACQTAVTERGASMIRITAVVLTLLLLTGSMAFSQAGLQGNYLFPKMRLLVPSGDKLRATNVTLRFEPDRIVLRSSKGTEDLKVFRYSEIRKAEYVFSIGPRYKPTVGTAILANVFAIPLFVVDVERHRLALESNQDSAILDLDKRNYKEVLSAFEKNTGKRIASVSAE